MADYIVKLWRNHPHDTQVPKVDVEAVTEFEAAAIGLNKHRQLGEQFDGGTGVEILQGNITHSKPVAVKDILYWLRNRPEGQALTQKDGLQPLLDYVPE